MLWVGSERRLWVTNPFAICLVTIFSYGHLNLDNDIEKTQQRLAL